MRSLMIQLFDIAYVSRTTWPLLISVAFMLADVHFRVELQFEARFRREENQQQPALLEEGVDNIEADQILNVA